MIYDAFINGYGRALSGTFQLDETVNAYVENASLDGAKTGKALIAAPGTVYGFTVGTGPIRGQLPLEGFVFTVSGGEVYVKDASDVYTLLGTVANDGQPVQMVANTTQVFLQSAGVGYCIEAGAVTPIASPPWTYLASIAYLNGLFIGLDDDGSPVGGQFFISSNEDCTTWDPLDFSNAPYSNNKLRALAIYRNYLLVIGSLTIQPFYYNGNPDFPIVPDSSAVMDRGTTAPNSVTTLSNEPQASSSVVFMLTESPEGHAEVCKIVGSSAVTVSTPQLSRIFQSYSNISDASGWAFEMGGHPFYQINFPSAQAAWRFDSSNPNLASAWSKVSWFNSASGLQEAHRGINHAFAQGRHLVGDRSAGIVWILSQSVYSDGDPNDTSAIVPQFMQRAVLLPFTPTLGQRVVFIPAMELLCEVGVGDGTGSGPGDDPVVDFEFSEDSGRTYRDTIEYVKLGKQGEYKTRVQCQRNGSAAQQPAVRITCSAPVKRIWTGLELDNNAR